MRVAFAAFWLHKDGEQPRDYEDAFAPASLDGRPLRELRCAVADGATESAYSRMWARHLVRGYADGRLTAPGLPELPALGRRWARSVAHAVARGGHLWYVERKAEDGAFAAFIGLDLHAPPAGGGSGTYTAIALGDSCLVHVRSGRIRRAFPLQHAAAFQTRPVLVPSRPAPSDDFRSAIACDAGSWERGDVFYVMSDALACWFLGSAEGGGRPWETLDAFDRSERKAFRRWVHGLRETALKNDDVTLLRIGVS